MKEQNGLTRAHLKCTVKPHPAANFGSFLDRYLDDVDDAIMVLTHNPMRDEEKTDADFDLLLEPECYNPQGTVEEFVAKANEGVNKLDELKLKKYLTGPEDLGLVHSSRVHADGY